MLYGCTGTDSSMSLKSIHWEAVGVRFLWESREQEGSCPLDKEARQQRLKHWCGNSRNRKEHSLAGVWKSLAGRENDLQKFQCWWLQSEMSGWWGCDQTVSSWVSSFLLPTCRSLWSSPLLSIFSLKYCRLAPNSFPWSHVVSSLN